MSCASGKSFLKRVLPFFLTFAVGLFIASFFVSISAPNFRFNRGVRRHQQYDRMLESEIQRLNEDNLRIKRQLADKEGQDLSDREAVDFTVAPPPIAPAPPTVTVPQIAPAKARTIPYNGR